MIVAKGTGFETMVGGRASSLTTLIRKRLHLAGTPSPIPPDIGVMGLSERPPARPFCETP